MWQQFKRLLGPTFYINYSRRRIVWGRHNILVLLWPVHLIDQTKVSLEFHNQLTAGYLINVNGRCIVVLDTGTCQVAARCGKLDRIAAVFSRAQFQRRVVWYATGQSGHTWPNRCLLYISLLYRLFTRRVDGLTLGELALFLVLIQVFWFGFFVHMLIRFLLGFVQRKQRTYARLKWARW